MNLLYKQTCTECKDNINNKVLYMVLGQKNFEDI